MSSEPVEKKVQELFGTYKQIKGLEKQVGSREKEMDKLIREIRIKTNSVEGGLSNPIYHCCLIDMTFYPDKSARIKLEQIPKVELFHKKVKKLKGQKVLSMSGVDYNSGDELTGYDGSADYIETGVISGPCIFKKSNMHVFIPVKQKFILEKDSMNWELKKESKKICVSQDVFHYLDPFFIQYDLWTKKYPKGEIVALSDKIAIYLGNKAVERALRTYQERKVSHIEKITGLEI